MGKFSDYFNSTTIKGRANVAKATYASFAAIYAYYHLKKSKNKTEERPKIRHKEEENYEQNGSNRKQFICPHCDECTKIENGHDTTEAINSNQSHHKLLSENNPDCADNLRKSENNHDHTLTNGEAIVSSSKSKCDFSCSGSQNNISLTSNEQKTLPKDDNNFLWWHPC